MFRNLLCVCVPLVVWTALSAGGVAQDLQTQEVEAIRSAVAQVAPSVVRIETIGGLEKVGEVLVGTGPTTGVLISSEGLVVSSAFNFVQMPTSILVLLPDGQRKAAKVVARDHSRKLVILKIEGVSNLPVPQFVNRAELTVGQWAIAVGRTLSPQFPNMSVGIVSATHRIWGTAIQTDAKISPSNYGGPLIDIRGRVMGILVPRSPQDDAEVAGFQWYDSGIGFAAPMEDVLANLPAFREGQDVHAGKLGVRFKGTDLYSLAPEVLTVHPQSPAYEAGLKPGDVVVAVDGTPIDRQAQFRHAIGPKYAGDAVQLKVRRNDQELVLDAKLVEQLVPYQYPTLGLLPERFTTGVVVRQVLEGSPAAEAGLQPGDEIIALDQQPLETLEQAYERMAQFATQQSISIGYRRNGEPAEVKLALSAASEAIPERIADLAQEDLPPPDPNIATGEVAISIPEFPNRCVAVVPSNYRSVHPPGLLVWLPTGKVEPASLLERWTPVAEDHNLIVLIPQPQEEGKWIRDEGEFVRKTIDIAANSYRLDLRRVCVMGSQAGGAMAYWLAQQNRDLVRGVVVVDAALPRDLATQLTVDPALRLFVLGAYPEESKAAANIERGLAVLRRNDLPVTTLKFAGDGSELPDAEFQQVLRWLECLDRL